MSKKKKFSFIIEEQFFQTTNKPAILKEAYWQDDVLSHIGATNIKKVDDCDFDSHIHLKVFSNELLVANTSYGTQQLSRSQKQLNMAEEGFFILGTMLRGHVVFKQKDIELSVNDKGILFYYAQSPFDIIFYHCEDILIKIPEHLLLTFLPTAKNIPALLFNDQHPYFQLIHQFIYTLYSLPSNTSYLQGLQMRESFLQSLVAAINHSIGTSSKNHMLDDYYYQKTLLFLKQNYQNDTLDNATVASAVNLSTGHLQKIFAKMDTSIMQVLWKIRLERAKGILSSNHQCKISDIAFQCGFKSPAHFSRVFKKCYAQTPRQWQSQTTKLNQ